MASNIVSTTIDAEYPIAGVDNDTQGFRDNFSIIKTNFAAAKTEIEDLQNNVARVDTDNNFAGNDLVDANLSMVTEDFYSPSGAVEADATISFERGHYQVYTITAPADSTSTITLNFEDWPISGRLAKIRLELVKNDSDLQTVILTSTGSVIKKNSTFPDPLQVDDNAKIIDVWTYNGGNTVYMEYRGAFSIDS